MTPDDRSPDLHPAPLPLLSSHVDARADAFAGRVLELTAMHNVDPDEAIKRTYREFDRIHKADDTAPSLRGMGLPAYIVSAVIVLTFLAFLIPALGLLVGEVILPLWRAAFSWL